MPVDKKSLAPNDLLLNLNDKAKNFNISKYEDFLFELCGDWDFQKEAIRKTLRYYLSDEYKDSKELFEENYNRNLKMQSFAKKDDFLDNLPFPYKLACTIDLATGTGKTWVMYAVARILLAEGIVDQVLILCPSKTIKQELYKKFTNFTANEIYTNSLPVDSVIKVPGIKHSDETIEKGDICIDNVHKTYDHVSSSISDSLERKGDRTLVINDEAHHILNPKDSNKVTVLEWKKFLDDDKYNFKFMLNVSGTPYKGNNYFNDVIYRYSIRDAINNKFVKNINYLTKDTSENWKDKWKAILNNHEKIKKEYSKSKKHITIVVTNSIANCNKLTQEIKDFLGDNTKLSYEDIDKKVIPITSSPQHDVFRETLKTIDEEYNPVEWVVSVSMLTEGWDVANIFQIVPHDARAFNSKLLISQVLGRGLRIPKEYKNSDIQPNVWIYNHTAWSSKIDHLVAEVAEISTIIRSDVIKKSKYNFNLDIINLKKEIINVSKKSVNLEDVKLPDKLGFISTSNYTHQEFTNIKSHRYQVRDTKIKSNTYSVESAVNAIYSALFIFDMNKETKIVDKVSKEYIRNLIEKELKVIGEDVVSESNLQRAKLSFGVLFRQAVGKSKIEDVYQEVETIRTKDIPSSSINEFSFRNYGAIVTCKDYFDRLSEDDRDIIIKLKKELGLETQTTLSSEDLKYYVRGKIIIQSDLEKYKSPLNLTLLSYSPERIFVEMLINEYIQYIDAWIKSSDKNFYSIPYIHRPGTHSLQRSFNPDFFIKKGNKIIVVEIKSKDDSTVKNKDKLEGAKKYFFELNKRLDYSFVYDFHFLDERDYRSFFENKIKLNLDFKSRLHADLENKSRDQLKEDR